MGHGVAKGNWDLEMRPALSFQYIYIYGCVLLSDPTETLGFPI